MLGPVTTQKLRAIFEELLGRPVRTQDNIHKDIDELYRKVVLKENVRNNTGTN